MVKLSNQIILEQAKELGFDLVGFAKPELLQVETNKLKDWLEKKHHASMDYMERNFDKRLDVKKIFPEAKSIISLAINYYTKHQYGNQKDFGKVSRYAWGKDYHLIIWEKLQHFENKLKEINSEFDCISYVDTGPVMDKVWAARAGIGWIGKHTNVITKEFGSWIFLATVICNSEFDYDKPMEDYCGTCHACIDACPTKAIVDEYVVDANKCISYLTIENKGEISAEYKNQFENWLFGCDICQDVCPWNNKFSIITRERNFEPANKEISLNEIELMTLEIFNKRFETSPIKRAKLHGLKRNAMFLKENI